MTKLIKKIPKLPESIFTIMSRMAMEYDAINLSQGFPDFPCDDHLISLVNDAMVSGNNQYAPMAGVPQLREILAAKINLLYNVSVDFRKEITITAGATQAIFTAIGAIVNPGDEVIILEPAYDSYLPSIKMFGGIPIPVPLRTTDFSVDWDLIQEHVSSRTKLLIINNPHNPSGYVFSDEDIRQLDAFLTKNDLYLLSDEVYEHLVYEGQPHLSVMQYPSIFSRSFVTFSFGKVFHNTGWKMGYCIAPDDMMQAFRQVHEFNVFSVNRPVQHAFAKYLEHQENYLGLSSFFEDKRDYFSKNLPNSRWKIVPSPGTYFQLLDYSEISQLSDIEFANYLCQEKGISAIPLSPFYSSEYEGKFLRFCFAKKKETLDAAIEKLLTI